MRSLLIATEMFKFGGLESHVSGEITCLTAMGVQVHLATGSVFNATKFPVGAASVETGLVMGPSVTIAELIRTVEYLRRVIRDRSVDCVHAHPFVSVLPGLIAAELEGVPFVLTLHGPPSLAAGYGPMYEFLLGSVVLPKADLVIAVSQEVADLAAPFVSPGNLWVLPNGVSIKDFSDDPAAGITKERWALVSRMDAHKIPGIREFVCQAVAVGLPGVTLIGDGEARTELQAQLAADGRLSHVEFVGAIKDPSALMREALGVAGMGRVVLEGLACGKPVVLVGYDGVKGRVTPELFRQAAFANFSGRNLPSIDCQQLAHQLSSLADDSADLINEIRRDYSDEHIWRRYRDHVDQLQPHGRSPLSDAYLLAVADMKSSNDVFLNSAAVWDLLARVVHGPIHFQPQLLASFNYHRMRFISDDIALKTADLKKSLSERDSQITSLQSALAENVQQIELLNRILVERDEQITVLEDSKAEVEDQIVGLRKEAESLFHRLTQVLQSNSWKSTRPLRAIARLARDGSSIAIGNKPLYDLAARLGRRLPFPLSFKARVRSAMLARAFPAESRVPIRMGGHVPQPFPSSLHTRHQSVAMQPARCGLIDGLVSIVLPVYNQADFLEESINSVLNQTYQKFELIIVDDGSTDHVVSVLNRYIDHPKVRCFTQPNQRLPKALSNGFSFANGEFWTWTSADNVMEPTMLESLLVKLQQDPRVGMTFADYFAIDDRGALLQDRAWRSHNRPNPASGEIRLPRTTSLLNVVQDNFIGPCFMYRGWIGRCLGDYDPQLGIEDYDYWMRVNAFFSIQHLGDDRLLYRYRVHDNTLSAKADEHRILEKAQRLMSYEKGRAAFYELPLRYSADSVGRAWLQLHGVETPEVTGPESGLDSSTLAVIGSHYAEHHTSDLLRSGRPVALLLGESDTRYHKLVRLLNGGRCLVLALDNASAARLRLVSPACPVVDAHSVMSLDALNAFVKNLLFFRSTRTEDELMRVLPKALAPHRPTHVALQVDGLTQGGMENVVIDLALSLESIGYRVTILNFGKAGEAAEKAVQRGLRIVSMPCDADDHQYRSWLADEQIDLVNAHYSIRGANACAESGIPFVQTIHNAYVWFDPDQIESYRRADRHTARYLCVSLTAARYADLVLGLDVGKMQVVPNGIDSDAISAAHFESNRSRLRKAWSVDEFAPVYLNVASIMATKAQLPLVSAFAQVVQKIPEARLVLLGAVMEASYRSAIDKAIRSLGLRNHVIFAGYDAQVAPFYHAADVFVLPSYWEGWSLSLGEALANGLPCVMTEVGSAYEFEGMSSVEIVEPPFGDLALLDYRNLGDFIYAEDLQFQQRLAESMLRLSGRRRSAIDTPMARQLDCSIAYKRYSQIFSDELRRVHQARSLSGEFYLSRA